MKNNIISKNGSNSYKVIEKNKNMILSFQTLKTHLMFLAEQYKPDSFSNYIHYWVESLNKRGRQQLSQAHQEFHKKIQNIVDDEKNKGNTPVFSIACCDLLWEHESEKEE